MLDHTILPRRQIQMPDVTIDNAPEAEAARLAAETANLAAQSAVATAAELAAQSQRAAETAVAEIAAETAEELAEQEQDLSWLREHARLSGEHRENVSRELVSLRTELEHQKTATAEILSGLRSLTQSLTQQMPATESESQETQIPPQVPPEGAAVPREAETPRRKRRLI
jgi:hypothetical protein